ncbi:signal peptidase I [Moraxella sp. ZY210820]|uniref:signal peptidase I n=1 Tax=unclassified Moraxella TaxID=2685852 RepID=UPI0027318D1A|nr:signal peptidase I [Moraxella sp. ZY210820]WLF83163.1 signal peptidase I [Moraxella sp. ZY210820]
MDFDFNLILVPATLVFFLLWLLDKLVLKQREKKGRGNENFIIAWAYDFWPVLAVVLFVRSFLYEPFNIPSESMMPNLEVGDFILVNKFDYGIRLPLVHTKVIPVGEPKAGDVAVFRYPENPKQSYIKRVIAVSGDTVKIENGVISVNGQTYSQTQVEQKNIVFTEQDKNNQVLDIAMAGGLYHEQIGDKQHIIQQVSTEQTDEQAKAYLQFRDEVSQQVMQQRQAFQRSAIVAGFPSLVQTVEFTVPEGHYFVMGDNRDQSADSRFWGFVPEQNLIGRAFYVWMHKDAGFKLPTLERNGKIN